MALVTLLTLGCMGAASADPWKDESGKSRERGGYARFERDFRDYGDGYREERRERRASKQEFWDGNCKVERKWDGDEYKEGRKCKGARRDAYPSYGYYRY